MQLLLKLEKQTLVWWCYSAAPHTHTLLHARGMSLQSIFIPKNADIRVHSSVPMTAFVVAVCACVCGGGLLRYKGFVFMMGPEGLGYYVDDTDITDNIIIARNTDNIGGAYESIL